MFDTYPLYLLIPVGILILQMLYVLVCALIVIGTKIAAYNKRRRTKNDDTY